jgi:uncharacterized membrane protein YfcA
MTDVHIIALLCTGLVQGLVSGILGAGGGWIMTPVQYWVYEDMGIPADIAIRMAFATGLFVIVPTCAASAWGHHRKGFVWHKAALVFGACGLAASFAGATTASHVSATPLKIVFGVTVIIIGVRMLMAGPPSKDTEPKDKPWLWAAWAIPISFLAGLIGVGGGVFLVPVMILLLGFPMHLAIGTSAAAIAMISIGGIAGYIASGIGVSGIPSPSIGYVYIWPWLCLSATSILMTQVGVRAAHRLPARYLAWIFSVVALYIGLRMIGVFEWLGWPL